VRRFRLATIAVVAVVLLAAACGDSDDSDDAATDTTSGEATETTAAAETTAAPESTEGGGAETTAAPDEGGGSAGCPEPDTSIDATEGTGAGKFIADITCSEENPLAAEGDPILIGFQNPEGDPAGTFPEYKLAAEAAVEYINTELGGLGADIANGVPGRPIQLEVCSMAINPADSQRCANELAGQDPLLVVSTLNFFGNHFPIYDAAGVTVIVGTPITVGDFTSPGVYSIGGGGGCLGVHTGLVEFVVTDLEATRVAVPWADTPPGVVCYYDLESKPLDVLKGVVPGDSERAGSMPDLEHIGVPILPATPDVTPQVTQVLDFEPDAIMFSAQGADCWNFVDGLGRLGWTPDQIPLVLSGACIDFAAMEAAGDLANGIYFTGAATSALNELDTIENERARFEAEHYQTKPLEYGLPETELTKGFATQGWNVLMTIWEMAGQIAAEGGEINGETMREAFATSDNAHLYGNTPMSCATAPAPYVAICNSLVSTTQWDGTNLVPVRENYSGIEIIAGTEILPGPY
jgi:branched-chain amino acid transport system substrate-binding protein